MPAKLQIDDYQRYFCTQIVQLFRVVFFRKFCTETYLSRPCNIEMARNKMYHFCRENRLPKVLFSNPLPKKRSNGESQKSGYRV